MEIGNDSSCLKNTVYLEDVADKLEENVDSWQQYFNRITAEFVSLSDGTYAEVDEELAQEIEESENYVRLPIQREIHEYSIMESFTEATSDTQKRERLFRSLNGRKPFRNFKNTICVIGLDQAYYAFRHLAYVDIARQWCDENDISYRTRKLK